MELKLFRFQKKDTYMSDEEFDVDEDISAE